MGETPDSALSCNLHADTSALRERLQSCLEHIQEARDSLERVKEQFPGTVKITLQTQLEPDNESLSKLIDITDAKTEAINERRK